MVGHGSKRSADQVEEEGGQQHQDGPSSGLAKVGAAASGGKIATPTKRARLSAMEQTDRQTVRDGSSFARGQITSPPPPPPEDELPPPPPTDGDTPPPPPPPEDGEEILPAPPPMDDPRPPSPPEQETIDPDRIRQIEEQQKQNEAEIGGADYWARLAEEEQASSRNGSTSAGTAGQALYLDTVNRAALDFDFEKVCSVSLSNMHVYACLVCGKYFQGRGPSSYAYLHSIDVGHRVFIHLEDGGVHILPDNYRVQDASLNDIQHLLLPTYSERQIRTLDAPDVRDALDLHGRPYLPGFVGLNNLGANDYINVIIQALAHVRPLRNFLLRGGPPPGKGEVVPALQEGRTLAQSEVLSGSSELVRRFASLVRKMWNSRNFKAQVSPHEFLQEVNKASKGRFSITQQGDPIEFLGWLLHRLHTDLGGGGKRNRRSIISDCFQGHVRIESQKVTVRSGIEADDDEQDHVNGANGVRHTDDQQEDGSGPARFNIDQAVQVDRTPFLLLTIDLPPMPVFQDVVEKNIIPQVPLAQVLAKYDGVTYQEARGMLRRFKVVRLPPFLILHFKRFTRNNFVEERNQTIVEFRDQGLNMGPFVDNPALTPLAAAYDMVANVTLDATPGTVRDDTAWRAQVHTYVDGKRIGTLEAARERMRAQRREARLGKMRNRGMPIDEEALDRQVAEEVAEAMEEARWFTIQDLFVEPIDRQLLFLGETYIQIWARRA